MRIQHNIMAMNAYRNYTNNVSAMKANLEKLSSGYKINRAGDDAAGLAISEKMRAQITGLETAQKNAKDGISLVQTAEGALTEVHDMLNRMVELATQSSNGTYDNTTDRAALQQELDQLKEEINRISKATNYNGINLLDGSMDGSDIPGELTNVKAAAADAADPALPEVGQTLGTDTVLHKGAFSASSAEFGINLHNVTFSNDDATGKITIKFGTDEIVLEGGATKATMDTGDILSSIDENSATPGTNVREMTIGGVGYNVEGDTLEEQLNSWVEEFNKDTAQNTNVVASVVDGCKVKFEAKTMGASSAGGGSGTGANSTAGADAVGTLAGSLTGSTDVAGVDGEKATVVAEVKLAGTAADGDTITIGNKTYVCVDNVSTPSNTITIPDGAELVLTSSVDDAWLAGEIRSAMGSIDGFDAPSAVGANNASDGQVFTYEAEVEGEFDETTLPTFPTVTFGGSNTGVTAATVQWSQDTNDGYVAGVDGVKASTTSDIQSKLTSSLTIAGYKVNVTSTDAKEQLNEFIEAYNKDKTNKFTAEWNDNGNGIKFTAKEAGVAGVGSTVGADDASDTANPTFDANAVEGTDSALGTNKAMSAKDIVNAIMNGKATLNGDALDATKLQNGVTLSDGATYKLTGEGTQLTFTQLETDKNATTGEINPATLDREVTITGTENATTKKNTVSGDYQKSTTFNTPNAADDGERLASTWFINTTDKVVNGASIHIGGKDYQFTTDQAAAREDSSKVYIGDLLNDEGKVEDADMEKVNERITVAARDNEVYTVGYDKDRLTFTERVGYTTGKQEYDLTQLSEIERSLGFTAAATPSEGKALTLQIGDTADSYNQISVNIAATNTTALGLDDISVADQNDAQSAVDVIKAAINKVSTIRGTLGATQNRLDHTINNLSVMTENIQDAESTIRDVDVAEEMMAYTKNNILIQSAQAMLAQANQVPQGVLQLLG